jgi:nucleoside phosphorylase
MCGMLVWVVALHCEAKPIIDFYHLKKSKSHRTFDLYQQGNIKCVVSGIGKKACTAATAWVAALNHDNRSIAWINLGTAGSAHHHIGTALLIHKISEDGSNRHFYPIPSIDSGFESGHCLTRNKPSTDYHPQQLFDMEASAFFDTATRFSSAKLVQCVKIVSDNPSHQTGKNKARISELIHQHIDQLAHLALQLQTMNEKIARLEIEPTAH